MSGSVRGFLRRSYHSLFQPFQEAVLRERARMLESVLSTHGLMPLLMKQRNGEAWSREDLREIYFYLKRLSSISPYLIVFVLPGSFLFLPPLAWWLDRRVQKRGARAQ